MESAYLRAPFDISTLDLNQGHTASSGERYPNVIYPNRGERRKGCPALYLKLSDRDLLALNREFFRRLDETPNDVREEYLDKGPFKCDYVVFVMSLIALSSLLYLTATENLFISGTHEVSGGAASLTLIALGRLIYVCDRRCRIDQMILHLYIYFVIKACQPYLKQKIDSMSAYKGHGRGCDHNNMLIAALTMHSPSLDGFPIVGVFEDLGSFSKQLEINAT